MTYIPDKNRYIKMPYKRCGDSGLKLPALSLGLWHNFGNTGDFENMKKMCFTAFDSGITHFDLADNYGPPEGSAEINFGKILNSDLKSYRDELVISTKAGHLMWDGPYGDFGSRKHLISGLDQSLKRMNIDYVDVFYHHRPDPETPLEETMLALSGIVKSGKALYIGLSKYPPDLFKQATKILNELKVPFIISQNRYSILDRTFEESKALETVCECKKGVIVFSPLAQGLLSGRYLNGISSDSRVKTDGRFLKEASITEELLVKLKKLNLMAEKRGQTLAQMALAWIYSKKEITSVLIGASKPAQITENIRMLENISFSEEELTEIDNIVKNNRG
ncbi:MAG: L-glyceraldehyde 3-phosphate reductase [Ruminococcaceae bacterium]|nr:L-glyceraldehyde 3-phosphate reductase [Oscillospiraceae bacterium]